MKATATTLRTDAEKKAVLSRLVRSTSEMVRNAFAPGGCVRTRFLTEIEALPDAEVAIRAYAVTLGPRICEAVHGEIREIFARARDAARQMNAKGQRAKPSVPPAVVRFVTETTTVSLLEESLFSRARNVFFGGIFGCTVGQFLGFAFYKCGFRTAPLVVPCVCAVMGLLGGYLDVRRRSCRGHKSKLVAHVNAVLSDLQVKYSTPQEVGSLSEIDRCLAVLCGTAPDRLPAEPQHHADASEKQTAMPRQKSLSDRVASIREWLQGGFSEFGNRFEQTAFGKKFRQIVTVIRS